MDRLTGTENSSGLSCHHTEWRGIFWHISPQNVFKHVSWVCLIFCCMGGASNTVTSRSLRAAASARTWHARTRRKLGRSTASALLPFGLNSQYGIIWIMFHNQHQHNQASEADPWTLKGASGPKESLGSPTTRFAL